MNATCKNETDVQEILDSKKSFSEWTREAFKTYSSKPKDDLLIFDNYRSFISHFVQVKGKVLKVIFGSIAIIAIGLFLLI